MRVLRGRATDATADRRATRALLEDVVERHEPAIRVWRPHRHVAFGRRDTHRDGYEAARAAAKAHGFPPHERRVGGRAVAYTGTTVSFVRCEPVDDPRSGIERRFERTVSELSVALEQIGVEATPGEPPSAFCPGDHSLSAIGKIVGVAQHVKRGAATVGGVVVVDDHERIGDVLADVYDALELPFDPDSVGSVARAEGETGAVRDAVEDALVGERSARVERIDTAP